MDNNRPDDDLHFGMPGDSREYENECDESAKRNAIPTAGWRRRAKTEFKRIVLGTSNVNRYEGKEGDDADEEEEASPADDGSTQNVED
jgi:hypothetical protein